MSDDFDTLRNVINRVFPGSAFELLSEADLARLRQEYPEIPAHYLDFLRHIGWGSLGEMSFMFYSGPVEAGDIFDPETARMLADILFIGDDFAGWSLGFDRCAGWRLTGVDSASPRPYPEPARTVAEFVAQLAANENQD